MTPKTDAKAAKILAEIGSNNNQRFAAMCDFARDLERENAKINKIEIEVCERLLDYWTDTDGSKRPKFHAQIKNKPGIWGCGKSSRSAIGSLIENHPEIFSVEISYLGELPR